MPLLLQDPLAHWLVVAAGLTAAVGEIVATVLGQARDGEHRASGALAGSVGLYLRRRRDSVPQDRGTKWIIVLGLYLGISAALAIANAQDLRAYANNWWTLGLGVAIVLAGVALRAWAIFSLGRFFRREVTIEPGQTLVRRGPYRALRHPSYTGILLIFTGFGLTFGSWVSAAVALLVVCAGMVPRIRVEERALANTFGAAYTDYANSTARLVPGVW